jgi:hypothetical protein
MEKTTLGFLMRRPAPPPVVVNKPIQTTARTPDSPKLVLDINHNHIFRHSVCICMLVQPDWNPEFEARINKLKNYFKYSFVVYVGKNHQFANIPNSLYIHMEGVSEAQMRNAYLNFVLQNASSFNMMMVIDPKTALLKDIPSSSLSSCCSSETYDSWDAVFANQSYKYCDLQSLVFASEPSKATKCFHIPANEPFIPVISAFGGLALYKISPQLSKVVYRNDAHVGLNMQLHSLTKRMFIVPSFILETPEEHAHIYV